VKILQVSTEDIDGGAARAAFRLNQALNMQPQVSSQMLVRNRRSGARTVIAEGSMIAKLGPLAERLPLRKYPRREKVMFSTQWFADVLAKRIAAIDPDVINLHWVCNGFLKVETLKKLNRPLVWTLHDMWPMTGGCHYSAGCDRYQQQCGNCPVLHSDQFKDLSFEILRRKAHAWKGLDLTIVAPSQWLADCARASALFRHSRIEVIANGLDTSLFRPGFKQAARALLNLPPDKKLLLFVAGSTTGDPRKGFRYLVEALDWLQNVPTDSGDRDFELAILGEDAPDTPLPWSLKTHYLGRFSDEAALALVYNAADVFVAPSVEDNLPNTLVEALACGTPCVAFKIGGMPDMIDHLSNGYLAKPFDIQDLAKGIGWALSAASSVESSVNLSERSRLKAEQAFDSQTQAAKVLALYQSL
jgi:glycosyltransferase involved in cell wall biosynthesis